MSHTTSDRWRMLQEPFVSRRWEYTLLAAVVMLGGVLRLQGLAEPEMLNDEAESSINALTILEHGVPWWAYQDLPIFENTLTRPWPESAEYEFRDTSYSDRQMAAYHGWVPLYSIAASFWLLGIEPDPTHDPPTVQHAWSTIEARKFAARLPAVLWAIVFMVSIYALTKAIYGRDAALLALGIAAFAENTLWMGQQARYFSATTALVALCLWTLWRIHQRGAWRDYLAYAAALVLLFHTHAISFVVACAAGALLLPMHLLREPASRVRTAVLGVLVCAGIVPWMWWSGQWTMQNVIPPARSLLVFPDDYLIYLRTKPAFTLLVGGTLLGLVTFEVTKRWLPLRIRQAAESARAACWWLLALMLIAYFGFLLLVPAASCFLPRISLNYLVPSVVLLAIWGAVLLRIVSPRYSTLIAAVGVVTLGLSAGTAASNRLAQPEPGGMRELVEHLRQVRWRPGTRVYADPGRHLSIAFYTGMPVQSIAPVRKEFLDRYPQDIVFIDTVIRHGVVPAELLLKHSADADQPLSDAAARRWEARLATRMQREALAAQVHDVWPPLQALPPAIQAAVDEQRERLPMLTLGRYQSRSNNPAMFREYEIDSLADFWPAFFYRFVDPASRSGANFNYANRLRTARAVVLDSAWTVYHSPGVSAAGAAAE